MKESGRLHAALQLLDSDDGISDLLRRERLKSFAKAKEKRQSLFDPAHLLSRDPAENPANASFVHGAQLIGEGP